MNASAPLPAFVRPNARDHRVAREIVDSHPVVSAYASVEWDCLHEDGREWMAAVVREAQARVALTADTIVHANAFLVHMAEHFRRRTSFSMLGIRFHTLTRWVAMQEALATFEASLDMLGVSFGDPEYGWDRDHAHELVDEELRHWEP